MRQTISWHLQRAIERYGEDLPLRIAALDAARGVDAARGLSETDSTLADGRAAADRLTETPESREFAANRSPRPEGMAPVGGKGSRERVAPLAPVELPSIPVAGSLDELAASIAGCTRCKLHRGRTQVVFGEGDSRAELMFVGEAPGAQEDRLGRPFVGPAGQLLTKIIENAVGLPRERVYIANVNKCRPPDNRNPEPDEVAACLPILRLQIELIRPKVIVALGRVAATNLLGSDESVTRLRGRELTAHGVPVVVTWHPAYLLRMPSAKAETWEDIKRVNRLLGRDEVPRRASS